MRETMKVEKGPTNNRMEGCSRSRVGTLNIINNFLMELTMVQQLIVAIPNLGVALFMLYHFMKRDEKKEVQNQANLDRFIDLQKESNTIHSKTSEILNTVVIKLNEMHGDVKNAKCRKDA